MTPRSHATPRYGFNTGLPWMVGVTGAIAAITITLPAQAAVLNDWSFDPATRQLQVTLPTGIDPNFLLLAEPARIILNLPNTQVGNVPLARQYSGAVRSVRVSQFDANTTRIVVELAPNTILDPRHAELTAANVSSGQRWTLRPLIVDGPNGATPAAPPTTAAAPAPATPPAPSAAVPSENAAAPPLPDLPDTGDAAAVGAVSPPVAPPYTADDGIRTDASALLGPSDGAATGPPPDALPIDPFAQRSQPAVSVPPLTDSAAPSDTPSQVASAPQNSAPAESAVPAPTVTVPPLPERAPSNPPATPPAPEPSTAPLPEPSAPASPSPGASPPAPTSAAIDSDATTGIPLRVEPPPVSAPAATAAPQAAPVSPPAAAATPQPAPSPAASSAEIPSSPESPAPDIAPPFLETTPPAAIAPAAPTATPPPFLEATPASPQGPETRTQPPPPAPQTTDGVIPFGTPLPEEGKAPATVTPGSELPVGTRLRLRYPGTAPLVLDRAEPWYEVLIVDEPVQHPNTGAILVPAGTQVLGRFENNAANGQRFISQVIVQGGDRDPVVATSDTLAGTPQGGTNLLRNSGIGAAAVMVLSGFSGVGILGGAALGAAATYATTPQIVVIQPGQIIEAEVIVPAPPAP
jgi:hypothetical protein